MIEFFLFAFVVGYIIFVQNKRMDQMEVELKFLQRVYLDNKEV